MRFVPTAAAAIAKAAQLAAAAPIAAALLPLIAAATPRQASAQLTAPSAAPGRPQSASDTPIRIDGDVSEWPEGAYVAVGPHHVAFRFRLPTITSLLNSPSPIEITADIDGSRETGAQLYGMGADVLLTFSSPRPSGDGPTPVRVQALERNADPRDIPASDVGLLYAPTHASDWFELRFDRLSALRPNPVDLPIAAVNARFRVGGLSLPEPKDAQINGVVLTPAQPFGGVEITPRPPRGRALRVMTWNVLWGQPRENPQPFARVIAALKPDVILFQEWGRDDTTEASVADWLNAHATWADRPWQAEASDASGTALAARHDITLRGPDALTAPGTQWNYPIRLAAAVVDTPRGPVVFGSTHLKCCGALGTEEDTRRLTEAAQINDALAALKLQAQARYVVFGGDLNMNGTTALIPLATAGLDLDGSDLTPASPAVLGDPGATYTFGRPGDQWPRARLDFITYPDSIAIVSDSFVLDPSILGPATLRELGLEPTDAAASDHLPVVVDLFLYDNPEELNDPRRQDRIRRNR